MLEVAFDAYKAVGGQSRSQTTNPTIDTSLLRGVKKNEGLIQLRKVPGESTETEVKEEYR